MLKRRHRKQIKLAQHPEFLKTIEKNGEKGMTGVIYTGGQRGTTAISDVWIQGLEVWQNRQLSNKATWQQPVICEHTRSNPWLALQSCLLSHTFHQDLLRNLEGNKVLGWMQEHVFFWLSYLGHLTHCCNCTDTKPVCFDTTSPCSSFFMPICSSWSWSL